MTISLDNLQETLDAIHDNLIDLPHSLVSKKQVLTIVFLMNEGLKNKDRETRIAVLKMLAGPAMKARYNVEIESTKNLSGRIASYLIDQFHDPAYRPHAWRLSPFGRQLLGRCEDAIETPTSD
jgi:hypothetical protein